MNSNDLFPIEKFPARARSAILAKFNGRRPSIGEVAAISDAEWLQLPEIGPGTLVSMRQATQKAVKKAPVEAKLTDIELLAERDRLRSLTNCLTAILYLQKQQLRTIRAELRARNLLSQQGKLQQDLLSYTSLTESVLDAVSR